MNTTPPSFRIAARALRQLGAELITSDDVALNELIKNAFDARSPRVTVKINSPVDSSILEFLRDQLNANAITTRGALEQIDRAISPDLDIHRRAEVIAAFRANAGGTPDLAEFIGNFLGQEYFIEVADTGVGMSADDLRDRFLVIGTPAKFLLKKNIEEGQIILGDKGVGRLSMMRLGARAIVRSKRRETQQWNKIEFDWPLFDDPNAYLGDIEVKVEDDGFGPSNEQGTQIVIRDLAAHWNAEKVGAFIQRYLRRLQDPFVKSTLPYPVDVLLNGKRQPVPSIPIWLEKCAQFRAVISFDPAAVDGSAAVLRRTLTWRDATSPEIRGWTAKELANQLGCSVETLKRLGPFTANCLWFNRQMLGAADVDRTRKTIADELNLWCGGFAVYRDGFRVGQTGGMEDDWLEWDSGALKAKGFTLNRYQTVGSVSISSRRNPFLVDAANRERLISCPEQKLLKDILGEIIVSDFRSHINATKEAETRIAIAEESTEESLRHSEESLRKTLKTIDEIGKTVPAAQKSKMAEVREALRDQVDYVRSIKNSLQLARETRVELLELANIGQVVDIVIHELSRLTERTGELLVDLEKKKGERDVIAVIDNLRTQIVATNKRIRSVDAMSPAGRHRKEYYDAVTQIRNIASGFKNRFKRHDIDCTVMVDGAAPDRKVEVHMVRGLIAQALENLLSNSVYWLQQGVREGDAGRAIEIEVDSKALTVNVSDNGPGVDPRYAKEIFRPYYTTRRKGKGLGLYIASELVEYHGGKLYLNETPDHDGRLRTFTIELPKE
ncbi:sensor histidine kinase [Paraburkholderia pallida]|uniref:histidine kinase n=1 Tax=Paraburkholderia pallida TaxID=2547399 RepID=A0A4P7CJR3_9BURK|nr:ATP-binding protein [Paraburkholderia pallida]QBQ95910.1 histidine kinase [Paraburkholderia pallida]